MIKILFLCSTAGLLASLAASLFVPSKGQRICNALITAFSLLAVFFISAVLFERFLGAQTAFLNPWYLLFLLIPLAAFILRLFFPARFEHRLNYPVAAVTAPAAGLRARLTRYAPLSLYTAAVVLFAVALARPVTVDQTVLPPMEGIDIMLLMDTSASMQNPDFMPNRFEAARRTAAEFISKRFNDRIGLVAFAKDATLQAPLTLDHEALTEYLGSMYLGMLDPTRTAIGDALGVAANHLKDSKAKSKIIILLTDGANNAGSIDPLTAAKAAAAYGLRIYAIGTASPPGSTVFSSTEDEIDEALLMEITALTGGKFYRAKNELELAQIYETINQLEKTEFTHSLKINQSDIYPPFLIWGLVLLALGFLLEKIFLIKVP